MNRTFLHTQYNATDMTRYHPDCDEMPTVKVYKQLDDSLIETPTVSKNATLGYATGLYEYTLDWHKYQLGSHYYDIVESLYNGNLVITDKRIFKWGLTDSTGGDADMGFDNNLYKAFFDAVVAFTDFAEIIEYPADYKIMKSRSLVNKSANFPCMTYSISAQHPLSGENLSTYRRSYLECRFWHVDNTKSKLLLRLSDMLYDWICESNDYNGLQLRNDVFYSTNIRGDQALAGPTGETPWLDDDCGCFCCGFRVIVDACCYA